MSLRAKLYLIATSCIEVNEGPDLLFVLNGKVRPVDSVIAPSVVLVRP